MQNWHSNTNSFELAYQTNQFNLRNAVQFIFNCRRYCWHEKLLYLLTILLMVRFCRIYFLCRYTKNKYFKFSELKFCLAENIYLKDARSFLKIKPAIALFWRGSHVRGYVYLYEFSARFLTDIWLKIKNKTWNIEHLLPAFKKKCAWDVTCFLVEWN